MRQAQNAQRQEQRAGAGDLKSETPGCADLAALAHLGFALQPAFSVFWIRCFRLLHSEFPV